MHIDLMSRFRMFCVTAALGLGALAGCMAEPLPAEPSAAVVGQVTIDDDQEASADETPADHAAEQNRTFTLPLCGGIRCPHEASFCCNDRCLRRVPGIRCVSDGNGGASQ